MRALAPLLQTTVFTILVPGIVAGGIPYLLYDGVRTAVHGAEGVAAIAVIVLGLLIYLHTAFWGFAWTGGGTPAPIAPTKVLVVKGLHRYVRNPMYIGVGLIIGGQAWLFHSIHTLIYFAAFGLVVHLFVVLYEEPTLRRQFGGEYEEYRVQVRRWLPRIRKG